MRSDLPAAATRAPLVVEALGYLGGALVVVALGLVTGWYWTDLPSLGRLAVVSGATLALAVAGAAVPRSSRTSSARLRAVLWLAATAGLFGFLELLGDDTLGWRGIVTVTFAAGGALVCAAGFWAMHHHPLQHIAFLASAVTLVGSAVAQLPHPGLLPAVAVWALGLAWGLLGWGDLVRPSDLGSALGALAALGGAVAFTGEDWGSVLAVGTAAALIVVAVGLRDFVLLVVASGGTLIILPEVVTRFFPGTLAAALALLVVGLLLVAAAVMTARRRRVAASPPARPASDWTRRKPHAAVAAAAAVLTLSAICILAAGA